MTINEKAAYIKGLAEGMKLSEDNPSEKLLLSIVDIIKELSNTLTDVDDDLDLAFDELEEIRDELEDSDYDEDDDDDEDDEDDEDLYELTCPKCGEKVYLDADEAESGESTCPACGEPLEIEFGGCDDDCCCCEDEDEEEAEEEKH
jgi:uncharacterized protein (UPF0212 family)